jgi:hypothetical protein
MGLMTNFDMTILNPLNGSGKWKKSMGGWECVKIYATGIDSLTTGILPEIGSSLDTPDGSDPIALKTIDLATKNKSYWIVTMNYAPAETVIPGGIERTDGKPEYSVDDNTLEKPIEDHPDYQTIWNYSLIAINGTSEEIPTWALNATNTEMSSTDAKKYQWLKEDQPVPEGWYKLASALDPRTENYVVPAPIIQEATYFKSLNQLLNKADFTTAVIKNPAGRDGQKIAAKLGGEYLIMSLNLRWTGEWWAINKSYQRADEWKRRIYNEG